MPLVWQCSFSTSFSWDGIHLLENFLAEATCPCRPLSQNIGLHTLPGFTKLGWSHLRMFRSYPIYRRRFRTPSKRRSAKSALAAADQLRLNGFHCSSAPSKRWLPAKRLPHMTFFVPPPHVLGVAWRRLIQDLSPLYRTYRSRPPRRSISRTLSRRLEESPTREPRLTCQPRCLSFLEQQRQFPQICGISR
jgi:hypothetical protein